MLGLKITYQRNVTYLVVLHKEAAALAPLFFITLHATAG